MGLECPLDPQFHIYGLTALMNRPLRQTYGMTELSPGTHVVPLEFVGAVPRAVSGKFCVVS
ncbi:hypothetical protein [Streptomyces purpureus]|uniref:hypothetical protein n=1 Tax=Streptomyces purpureus TaxID=1951 RepID=UPI0003741C7B|nr:hypothetical protein [Streptomyces purpureus]